MYGTVHGFGNLGIILRLGARVKGGEGHGRTAGSSTALAVLLSVRGRGGPAPHGLVGELQGQLDLPWGVGGVGFHEVVGELVVARIGGYVGADGALYEGGGGGDHAVGGDGDALVVAVEKVEGFAD
jgi:hypothetical protein